MRTPTLPVRVQLPLGWNTYLLFNTDTVHFVWKTDREAEKIVLLMFVRWRCLDRQWMRDDGVGQKFLFRAGVLAEAISMTNSDMLPRLDICTFFMNHCCFRFSSVRIHKRFGFPLSTITFTMVLQSTATLVTISINMFICFKYTVWNQFFD